VVGLASAATAAARVSPPRLLEILAVPPIKVASSGIWTRGAERSEYGTATDQQWPLVHPTIERQRWKLGPNDNGSGLTKPEWGAACAPCLKALQMDRRVTSEECQVRSRLAQLTDGRLRAAVPILRQRRLKFE